jgi:uncharacterized protein (TIGR00369 family)
MTRQDAAGPREGGYIERLAVQGESANPFFGLAGIRVARHGEGVAVLTLDVRPDMHNGEGWLQGGLLVALADEAMALAVCTLIAPDERVATVTETTQFLKGVREGRIVATARVSKRGRRVAFLDAEVHGVGAEGERQGDLLSRTSAVFAIGPR